MLERTGHALSPSSKFDLIVKNTIMNKEYNIFETNSILFDYDEDMF